MSESFAAYLVKRTSILWMRCLTVRIKLITTRRETSRRQGPVLAPIHDLLLTAIRSYAMHFLAIFSIFG